MTLRRTRAILALLGMLATAPLAAQTAGEGDDAPDATVPAVLDAEGRAAVAGINAFSLDLYRRTLTPGENHFLSPASVSVAMGLAYRGAKGQTAAELDTVLRFGLPPADYLRANARVLASMDFAGKGRELRTGNAIWLQRGTTLRPDYEQDMARYAGAGLQRVDFQADPDVARGRINAWVEERTRDKIRNLLGPTDVSDRTRTILVNTIYWKGNWASAFYKAATKPEPFTGLSGDKIVTSLMNQRKQFRVLERDGVKAILLPYAGGEIEMAAFLPNSPKGLSRFEERLTEQALAGWLADLENAPWRDTILTLPSMHLEQRMDLAKVIAGMGAPTAFSPAADFSGISDTGLQVSKVIHQTYLDVDEEGSEAAAATAVVMDIIISAAQRPQRPPPPPFIFRADQPFLFLLRDRRTGLILFMGRYVAPPAG